MSLQAYYDGSGKSGGSRFITLAGIAAPEELWPHFNAQWAEVLARHQLIWWHTSAAMNGSPQRAKFVKPAWRNGWNKAKATAARIELFNVILSFHWEEWKNAFQIRTCTVNMEDYRTARSDNRWLRPPEAICVNTCVGLLKLHRADAPLRLCFDRNEEFMKQIEQVWTKDRKKPNVRWAHQIKEITPGTSETTVGLQAADLVAWEVNRAWSITTEVPLLLPLNGIVCRYYNREEIDRVYPSNRERKRKSGMDRAGRKTSETHRLVEGSRDS